MNPKLAKKLLKKELLKTEPSLVTFNEIQEVNGKVDNLAIKQKDLEVKVDDVKEELKKKFAEELHYEIDSEAIRGLRGDRGDNGYTPIKGIDYFDGENGYTPIKGKDYFDGKDGMPGKNGEIGKQGLPGRDGYPDTPDEIAEKLNTLEEAIESSVIKGLPKLEDFLKKIKKDKLIEMKDVKDMPLDLRWHGGGMTESVADTKYLKIDQTVPQTVINDSPTFDAGIITRGIDVPDADIIIDSASYGGRFIEIGDNRTGFLQQSALANPSQFGLGVNATGGYVFLQSNHGGSGTTYPIQLFIDAVKEYEFSGTTFNLQSNNLTTSGTITGVNVTSGVDPGHTHSIYLTDAPSDGTMYGRRDGAWERITLMPPVEEYWDITEGLPVGPEVGDRYISDGTDEGLGWYDGYIYEWDGEEWVESIPVEGWMVWLIFEMVFWVFFSGGWMEVGSDSFLKLDQTTPQTFTNLGDGTGLLKVTAGVLGLDDSTYLTSVTAHNLLSATHGDTVVGSALLGDLIYADATPNWTKLAGNTTTTKKFLRQTGTGAISAIPAWDTVLKVDVGLASVEDTALSTWAGSANITTLGTIATGIWNGTDIAVADGGTGLSTMTTAYGVVCAGTTATGALQVLNSLGNAGEVLTSNGAGALPTWQAGGGGGAPTTAHYLTSQAEAGLSAEVNLGALATGLLYGTVAGGVSTISSIAVTPQANADGFQFAGGTTSRTTIFTGADITFTGSGTRIYTFPSETCTLGLQNTTLSVYASGAAAALTATPALLDFGTTDPSLTITTAGTYLLLSRVRIDYNGSTFAAVRTVTLKLRRTNNTAADVTGATTSALTQIITALTYTMGSYVIPPVIYTTAQTTDIIQIFGSINVVPTAGNIQASEAEIVAIRLY